MNQLPSKAEILQWIHDNPGQGAKRDIARAFGLKGAAKVELKHILRELEDDGALEKRKRSYRDNTTLPPVSILSILPPDPSGDQFATALEWGGDSPPPRILFVPRKGDAPVAEGDRILARLSQVVADDHAYEARLIRKIGANPLRLLGIFRQGAEGGRIVPIDKGQDKEWTVARDMTAGARDGELVEAEQAGPRRMGLPTARIVARLGDPSGPRAVSLIAIHQHGIPDRFPDEVMAQADAAEPASLQGREDLRDLPLVTIDPSDARDHDDAVYAEADADNRNPGGHILWVAIADVAHYVTPQSALDREARKRGNSTYFPDRVVPMLPDTLSGDLCSLHEGVDRPCIAVRMVLDTHGRKLSHRFMRGMMRSAASLTYEEAQEAVDGHATPRTEPMLDTILRPLYAAYASLKLARTARQPLELDLPERKIVLAEDGRVVSVAFKERFDAHRLIEEFMVLANVAAAEELIARKRPLLFRVHEEPAPEKLESLREVAEASGFTLAKGQVLQTAHLNRLLAQAEGSDFAELMNISTLRSMQQAYYHPENFGHFGLALRSYAHFTSPIRRYSDLLVHRALIAAHGWGKDGLSVQDVEMLDETAKLISDTERRSMVAERDTNDRYLAAYLADRVGNIFQGRISGVVGFGLFVKLDETGADGLVPIRSVGREYFHYDRDSQTLMGADTGVMIGIGQRVTVRLAEAVPVTGGIMLELLEIEDRALPAGTVSRGRGSARRPGQAHARDAKRKVIRKRR
jgi:ribonuclease R